MFVVTLLPPQSGSSPPGGNVVLHHRSFFCGEKPGSLWHHRSSIHVVRSSDLYGYDPRDMMLLSYISGIPGLSP